MKKLIFISIIFNSIFAFSQTEKDNVISKFKNQFKSASLRQKNSETNQTKKWKVYRFCSEWKNDIEYLSRNLLKEEIFDLKNDENATLNLVGIIIELKKNNSKEYALSELNKLIDKPTKYINYGCYDTMTVYSLSNFFLYLYQDENEVFKPNFELSKSEILNLEAKIILDEENERE